MDLLKMKKDEIKELEKYIEELLEIYKPKRADLENVIRTQLLKAIKGKMKNLGLI